MNGKPNRNDTRRVDDYHLSPKQATALRHVGRNPWTIERASHILQTTLGALYKREYVAVEGGYFKITSEGEEALRRQAHSDIERSRSMYGHGFAAAIQVLKSYEPPKIKRPKSKVLRWPQKRRRAA